jgi:peroxiredoxin
MLLVFYRGGWCPFCNFQVRDLVKNEAEFTRRQVLPVLISVDAPSSAQRTQAAHEVPFPLLSDSELVVHKAFKVLDKLETDYVEKLKSKGMDLKGSSGQDHGTVAVPAMFLIDSGGKVLFAHADKDYKVRPRLTDLLAKLDEVLGANK